MLAGGLHALFRKIDIDARDNLHDCLRDMEGSETHGLCKKCFFELRLCFLTHAIYFHGIKANVTSACSMLFSTVENLTKYQFLLNFIRIL